MIIANSINYASNFLSIRLFKNYLEEISANLALLMASIRDMAVIIFLMLHLITAIFFILDLPKLSVRDLLSIITALHISIASKS
jgi:hypothetical protein